MEAMGILRLFQTSDHYQFTRCVVSDAIIRADQIGGATPSIFDGAPSLMLR
jgi:hypothetical protein